MKKRLTAVVLAAIMLFAFSSALAQDVRIKGEGNTKAILLCYDNSGKLVYSNLLKTDADSFDAAVPAQYEDTQKKVYYIDTQEFRDLEAVSEEAAPTAAPEPTAAPSVTAAPTQTPKATKTPVSDTPYEKEVDRISAPAMVKAVAKAVDGNNDDIYTLTVLYLGKEAKVNIEEDLKIRTAPSAYASMLGKNVGALEEGDVIVMTANIAGDAVRAVDFITRPTADDIVTGTVNYGDNFENLFSAGGSVANQWGVMKYGEKASKDRYKYAYGIVGRKNGSTLTLLNKSGDTDKAIEVDLADKAYVYVCDVDGKDYDIELGDISDISSDIPQSAFNNDIITLNDDYSYNYALVRVVDGTATDIVLYNNYNN